MALPVPPMFAYKTSEIVIIGNCQNWKLSESEIVRIGICQNWKLSEFAIGEFSVPHLKLMSSS